MTREYGYGKALNTKALSKYLCVGVETAIQIGHDAGAEIYVGKKRIYNRTMVDDYIDRITGQRIELRKCVREIQEELDGVGEVTK